MIEPEIHRTIYLHGLQICSCSFGCMKTENKIQVCIFLLLIACLQISVRCQLVTIVFFILRVRRHIRRELRQWQQSEQIRKVPSKNEIWDLLQAPRQNGGIGRKLLKESGLGVWKQDTICQLSFVFRQFSYFFLWYKLCK